MLSSIREKTQGWIAGIILGLIAIPFALWGVNSYFENAAKIVVAEVDGVEIGSETYKRALEQQRRSLEQMLGTAADRTLLDNPQFKARVLDTLVDEMLVIGDAEAQGYRVGDGVLAQLIRQNQQFQRDGKFDSALYEAVLRNAGLDVRGYEARVRQAKMIEQLESGFAASAIVTQSDIAVLTRLRSQVRETAYVTFAPERYMASVSVTPAAVEEHYAAHREEYKSAERVRIEYLRLSAAEIGKTIKITDDELRKAYSSDADRYVTPEQRRASHILVKAGPAGAADNDKQALSKIEGLRAQLVGGADFAKLARQHSQDTGSAAKGGDLGVVGRGTLAKEFEDALFAMKPGQLSQPVRTSYGYHLIKLVSLKPEVRKPFTEVRGEIEAQLRARRAEEQFFELSERFRNLVYEQPDSLVAAARALGLQVQQSDWFTRAGGRGVTGDRKVVEAAFDPEVVTHGRNSPAIETGVNTLIAVRIAGHEEAAIRPLNDVRAEIELALRQRASREEADRVATALLGELRKGASLDALARQRGIPLVAGRSLSRRETHGMDAALVDALFRAPRPVGDAPVYGRADLARGGVAVFALRRVQEGKADVSDKSQIAEVQRLLSDRRGRNYLDYYRTGLRQQAKIKVYPDRL